MDPIAAPDQSQVGRRELGLAADGQTADPLLGRRRGERVQQAISNVLDATTLNDLCDERPARKDPSLIAIDTITGARATVREGCLKTP